MNAKSFSILISTLALSLVGCGEKKVKVVDNDNYLDIYINKNDKSQECLNYIEIGRITNKNNSIIFHTDPGYRYCGNHIKYKIDNKIAPSEYFINAQFEGDSPGIYYTDNSGLR